MTATPITMPNNTKKNAKNKCIMFRILFLYVDKITSTGETRRPHRSQYYKQSYWIHV